MARKGPDSSPAECMEYELMHAKEWRDVISKRDNPGKASREALARMEHKIAVIRTEALLMGITLNE